MSEDLSTIKGEKVTIDMVWDSFIIHQMRVSGCSYEEAKIAFNYWLRDIRAEASSAARSDAAWEAENARWDVEENRHNNWENMGW